MAKSYTRRINLYINDKEVKNNIQSIQKEFYKANTELKGMEIGSKEYINQMSKVKGLKKIMTEHNQELTQTQTKTQKLIGAAKGMLPAMGWAAVAAGAVAAAKKIAVFVDETFKMRQQVQKLTGLTGKDLADMTAGLKSTADTFKQDFEQLAIANNAFAQSMNISQQEANNLINDGFLAGADASGEFLTQLKEYGPQFAAAGLSAEQAIVLMSQSATEGLFSDKGADSIKEATLRLREMPASTQAALEGIGISSQQMMSQLANGEITVFEAIQQVSRKLGELPPQSSQVGTAIADIFGGAGEDAGLEFITMLGTAETSMEELKKRTGETGETQQMLLNANQQLNQAWSDLVGIGSGGFDKLKAKSKLFVAEGLTGLIQGVKDLRVWFVNFYNSSKPLRIWLGSFGLIMKTNLNIARTALLSFWEGLKSVVNIVEAVFTGKIKKIPEIIKNGFGNIGEEVKAGVDRGKNHFDKFIDEINNGHIELAPIEQEITIKTNNIPANNITNNKKNEIVDPLKALELGFEKEKLIINKQYAEKESLQKEYNAKMLANEIAFATAKLEIVSDEKERVAIQQQLVGLEAQYKVAVQEALIPMLQKKELTSEMNLVTLESNKLTEISTAKANEATQAQQELNTKLQGNAQQYQQAIGIISQGVYDMASGSEDAMKTFAKAMLKFALEQLKIQAQIAAAGATVQSLSQPDSIATFGATGLVRAAIIVGLIEAAFAGLGALVDSFEVGGYTAKSSSDSKPVGIVHANEWVASAPLVRDPEARRHIDFLQRKQEGLSPVFDTGRIASSISPRGFQSGGYTGTGSYSGSGGAPYPTFEETAEMIVKGVQVGQAAALFAGGKLEAALTNMSNAANKLAEKEVVVNAHEVFLKKQQYDSNIQSSNF